MKTKRIGLLMVAAALLAVLSCRSSSTTESSTTEFKPPATPAETGGTPTGGAQPTGGRGTLVVEKLPDGAVGVELKDGAVHLLDGYEFEKDKEPGTFMVRQIGGTVVMSGGCGCRGGGTGTCDPKMEGGIIVCAKEGQCERCGLAVMVGGSNMEIMSWD